MFQILYAAADTAALFDGVSTRAGSVGIPQG